MNGESVQRLGSTAWRRWGLAGGLAAVLAVAAAVRALRTSGLERQGAVLPIDGDSAYHLRRIEQAIETFPRLPAHDPWINWPRGAFVPWSDGFDVLAAAFVKGLRVLGCTAPAAAVAAWFTLVLGVAAVGATVALARTVLPRGEARSSAALAAGLLTALYQPLVGISYVGYLDHHVAEVLSMLALANWALRALPGEAAAQPMRRGWFEVIGTVVVAAALWVFSGGVLYVGLAAAVLVFAALARERPTLLGSGTFALAGGAAVAALLTAPAVAAHGRLFAFQLPSMLQPALTGVAAIGVALVTIIGGRWPASRSIARLTAAGGALAACAVAGVLVAPSAAREVASAIAGWLLRGDPWIAQIAEFQPIAHTWLRAALECYALFGATGVFLPVLLAAGGVLIVRRTGSRGVALTLLAVALTLLTFIQNRFARALAPFLAVNVAIVLQELASRYRKPDTRLASYALPLAVVSVLAVADPQLRVAFHPPSFRRLPAHVAAALDLRERPMQPGAEGVLTPWDLGHAVSVIGNRPVVVNGFGPYLDPGSFTRAESIFRDTPVALDRFMSEGRLGYAVAGAITGPALGRTPSGHGAFERSPDGLVLDLEFLRERPLGTLLIAGSGVPQAGVPHLSHLLPVFASEQKTPGLSFAIPVLWVYERVSGARMRGIASPGARVVAALEFWENERRHVYRAWGDAAASGEWEIVVPLPTSWQRPTIRTADAYAVAVTDGPPVAVSVPEAAVRAGEVIDLRSVPSAAQARGGSSSSRGG